MSKGWKKGGEREESGGGIYVCIYIYKERERDEDVEDVS